MMKYRDVEYTVVQGIERGLWKWSASVAGVVITGQAAIKSEAVREAERAIDRALAPKKGADRPARGLRCAPAPRGIYGTYRRSRNLNQCFRSPPPSGPEVIQRRSRTPPPRTVAFKSLSRAARL